MAFMPPQEQREIPGLDPEFVRTHEGVFCGAPAAEPARPGGEGEA
jgi:hypothetical protein